MLTNRYAVAILHFLAIVAAALLASLQKGSLTPVVIAQLVVFTVSAFGTILLPLIGDAWWAGVLKIAVAVLGAGITAAVPFIAVQHFAPGDYIVVILAVLNVLGVGVGVAVRQDAQRKADLALAA